ncbi:MAG: alpha/beta hydrolase [Rhizobiaceae bacterium]
MQTVRSTDGTPIAYEQQGSGPHLLLVHGTATIRAQWATIFEQHFTVTAMERRGRGDSGDAPDYAIEREFEDIVAVVDALGGPVLLFGHSYGALCALGATMLTEKLAGLILYEPSFSEGEQLYSPLQIERLETLAAEGDGEAAIIAIMAEIAAVSPREIEQMKAAASWPKRVATAQTIARELRAEQSYRLPVARVGKLSLPVLLLLGGDSPPELANGAQRLQEILPNARTVVMPGAQHTAMYTNPDMVVAAVLGFSRDIAPNAKAAP